ncbi:hypothetical protein CO675_34370 [Bradyrhizobium sp. C9]|nr:hypothetical protein CO675_34370 [Bradyrhizobium sp. C9]
MSPFCAAGMRRYKALSSLRKQAAGHDDTFDSAPLRVAVNPRSPTIVVLAFTRTTMVAFDP